MPGFGLSIGLVFVFAVSIAAIGGALADHGDLLDKLFYALLTVFLGAALLAGVFWLFQNADGLWR